MSTKKVRSSSMALGRRDFIRWGGSAAAVAASAPLLASCSSGGSGSPDKIRVWWDQGYYPAEGDSVKAAIKAWEAKTGKTAELTLVATDSLAGKMTAAVQAGNPPEVAFGNVVPSAIYANEDELVDVSDVVEAASLTPAAKKGAHLFNAKKGSASYYAAPLGTTTTMIFYWENMLKEAGMGTSLPTDWDGFWNVFKEAQGGYKAKSGKPVNAVGWTLGSGSMDTNEHIRFAIMSFGLDLINDDMQLNPVTNETHTKLTAAIAWLVQLYQGGYIPQQAISWSSPDNNTALMNHTVLMTPNSSLSIPAAVKSQSPKEYKQLVTTMWPDRQVGGAMPAVSEPWNACVFKKSGNPDLGKDFLKFFMQPKTLNDWLIAAEARRIPVDTRVLDQAYWSKSDDPNITTTVKALSSDATVPAWVVSSAPYQKVVTSGMWGDVLGKAVTKRQSPQDSAKAALDRLTQLFKDAKQMAS